MDLARNQLLIHHGCNNGKDAMMLFLFGSWISVSKELFKGIVYWTRAELVWSKLKEDFEKVNDSQIFSIQADRISAKRSDLHSNHCNNGGHTKDTCYKLHGHPSWHPLSFLASNQRIRSESSSNLAGKFISLMSIMTNKGWIIGMDATAQKTSDFKNLEHPQPGSSSLHTVKLANNSLAKVTHSGTTALSPNLKLLKVLYIPYFKFNLLCLNSQLIIIVMCFSLYLSGSAEWETYGYW